MAALLGDASCGPVNPLATLSKTFQRDRSLQQDRIGAHAGPSQSGFRSAARPGAGQSEDAARFFGGRATAPFDVRPLQHAIHQVDAAPSMPAWASDFAAMDVGPTAGAMPQWARDFSAEQPAVVMDPSSSSSSSMMQARHAAAPHRAQQHYAPRFGQQMRTQTPSPHMYASTSASAASAALHQAFDEASQSSQWETAFKAQDVVDRADAMQSDDWTHEAALRPQHVGRPASPRATQAGVTENDELARTAGELIRSVGPEANEKFANSSFMELMRKLRDHEVAVEGNKVVEQVRPSQLEGRVDLADLPSSSFGAADVKGKGRAAGWGQRAPQHTYRPGIDHHGDFTGSDDGVHDAYAAGLAEMQGMWDDEYAERDAAKVRRSARAFQGDGGGIMDEDDIVMAAAPTFVPGATASWEEDFDAADIVGAPYVGPAETTRNLPVTAQQQEWDKLQSDWDAFEATSTGIEPLSQVTSYPFQASNPFMTRQHARHQARRGLPADSVLECEAAVQLSPHDPNAWLALGVKQQENEREHLAIAALKRALELDPSLQDAWLALAVSYTNESERSLAYESVDRWIGGRGGPDSSFANPSGATLADRHRDLTERLITMARATGNDVDADVQIALGVLFNTSEEYAKAGDCFGAALSVRPDDPLCLNRLGATLANSGQSSQAIAYYERALEVHPTYARARYNLAISSISLGAYAHAAEHLLQALELQHDDAAHLRDLTGEADPSASTADAGGLTSDALWSTLRMCCSLLGRTDLFDACDRHDLDAFVGEFGS